MHPSLDTVFNETLAFLEKESEYYPELLNYVRVHAQRHRVTLRTLEQQGALQGKVLDLGAAPFFLSECMARIGMDVVAADIHPDQWRFRKKLSCSIVAMDCDGRPFNLADSQFDMVIMTEVFEHLRTNLITTAKEILRVLRPGGMLYLTTPNLFSLRKLSKAIRTGSLNNLYAEYSSLDQLGYMGHVREYTPREIELFFEACGFASVMVWTENAYKKPSTLIWRMLTLGLPRMRDTICSLMTKPHAHLQVSRHSRPAIPSKKVA
jgi:SAM-dependent methyltransferase